jgi:hypothetical protein
VIARSACGKWPLVKVMATLTAEELRQRCEEARKIAEEMKDPSSRHTMMGISLSYDRLALRALIDERLGMGALIRETNKLIGSPWHDDH